MTAEVVSITSARRQSLPTESGRGAIDISVGELSLSELRSLVESAMIDAVLRAQTNALSTSDNPFDAVYIADLRPDIVSVSAIADILAVSRTSDLSLTLALDDIDD